MVINRLESHGNHSPATCTLTSTWVWGVRARDGFLGYLSIAIIAGMFFLLGCSIFCNPGRVMSWAAWAHVSTALNAHLWPMAAVRGADSYSVMGLCWQAAPVLPLMQEDLVAWALAPTTRSQ
jgi:hypothetical protein